MVASRSNIPQDERALQRVKDAGIAGSPTHHGPRKLGEETDPASPGRGDAQGEGRPRVETDLSCRCAGPPSDLTPSGSERKALMSPPKGAAAGRFTVVGVPPPAPGNAVRTQLGDTPVAVFNVEGTLFAIDATCPHAGGPLDEGEVEGGKVTCPWHGSVFDLRTGAVETPPARKGVTAYSVRREGNALVFEPQPHPGADGQPSRPSGP